MSNKLSVLLFLFFITLTNCESGHEKKVAIRDFGKSLQPHLIKLVSKGCVYHSNSTKYIEENATDEELRQLSKSESPTLRAFAFAVMLKRPSFDHFQLIMENLDDSAIVATDDAVGRKGGTPFYEFQIEFARVSEYLLSHASWKDSGARSKTIIKVVLKHNYLRSAYEKLLEIQPNESYYPSVRKMIERESTEDAVFHLLSHRDYECALYGLAKFKKPADTSFIREGLTHTWQLSDISFQLMQDYPNDAYMDILETFYKEDFYDQFRFNRTDIDWYATTFNFFRCVASYRDSRSARILDSILNKKPFMPNKSNAESLYWIKRELVFSILDNSCEAYSKIGRQIQKEYGKIVKEHLEYGSDPERAILRSGNLSEPISWR